MPNVTLVTGAAGALGSAVVAYLVQQGHKVAAVDLPRASERLGKLQGALALPFDGNDANAWHQNLTRVERELGPVTGAVLVAGAWQGGGPLHTRTSDDIWEVMIGANLASAYRALRALVPGMVERKAGSIVLIGSRAADRPDTSAGAA